MQIKFCAPKVNMSAQNTLELSRMVRQCREETEDVLRQLRPLTELDGCCTAIVRQMEAMGLLTARVVGLSSSLREISELYTEAEERNLESLEEVPHTAQGEDDVLVYGVDSVVHRRLQNILYQ